MSINTRKKQLKVIASHSGTRGGNRARGNYLLSFCNHGLELLGLKPKSSQSMLFVAPHCRRIKSKHLRTIFYNLITQSVIPGESWAPSQI